MIEGQGEKISYVSTTDGNSLRFMMAITSEENKELSFVDALTAFRTNFIFNPEDRQRISVPILHLEFFHFRFPKHEIAKYMDQK